MIETSNEISDIQFPVVGIGASAGGQEAIRTFLTGVPEKSGMAYVFVQHLNPGHESHLKDILSKDSRIPVIEVTDNIKLEPDTLYIIPPDKILTAEDGKLKLEPRNDKLRKIKTIDLFFSSLGVVHQSFAVGIILSGLMDDGTSGLRVIKENGGITIVQDETAAYAGMPRNAINSGVVDFILPPDKMVEKLIEINKPFLGELLSPQTGNYASIGDADVLRQILSYIRIKTGVDFTYYKKSTLVRRLQRRMAFNKCETAVAFLNLLRGNVPERQALVNDLLISVTDFFRDPRTFRLLCNSVLPDLVKMKKSDAPLRIWVAGCATGEEVYSIAICLEKVIGNTIAGRTLTDKKVQVFGTDLSETAIAKARAGIYNERDIKNVTAEDRKLFFLKIDGGYQVNKSIRECCVFARHDLLHDPPFSKIDMVSCRNLLIYLEPVLQKKALSILHYSLKEKGILLLGKSETIGANTELFGLYNKEEKLYIKKGVTNGLIAVHHAQKEVVLPNHAIGSPLQSHGPLGDIFKTADKILLSKFTPAGVLVNENFDIIQFRGSTGPWLTPSAGKPSFNIMKMAREGLSFELRNLLHLAKTKHEHVKKEGILFNINGTDQYVTIEAVPVDAAGSHFLVLFQNRSWGDNAIGSKNDRIVKNNPYKARADQLERELSQIREDMCTITENLEAANEELQSANEELLSGSEELQATNEELETAKEELESTNEELTTLNHELLERFEELNKSRKYTEDVFATIRDPLIVVDHECNVIKATPGFYKKYELTEEETKGKLLFHLHNHQWDIPELRHYIENISGQDSSLIDFDFTQTFPLIGQRNLVLNARRLERVQGYKTILISIEDITDRQKIEQAVAALKRVNADLVRSNLELEQFAGIASHDLQEPLRKIITFINIIIEKKLEISEPAKPYISKIALAAQRMSQIIKDLLDYARISGIDQAFLPTDLNEVIKKVLSDLEVVVQEKAATVDIKPLPVVPAVALYMNQLFYNLLNNALKFSKKDVPALIEVYATTPDREEIMKHPELNPQNSYTEIIVRDNGIGFNVKYSEQVFRLFQRINVSGDYPGTGIGLALCRKIVLQHNGKIWVESKENVGSAFHILLPTGQVRKSDV